MSVLEQLRLLQFGWLDQDTAVPTRRLASVVIWLFALAMAYPYLPGSHSAAFQGVTVLAGLMLSIGASSIVGQGAAGLECISQAEGQAPIPHHRPEVLLELFGAGVDQPLLVVQVQLRRVLQAPPSPRPTRSERRKGRQGLRNRVSGGVEPKAMPWF